MREPACLVKRSGGVKWAVREDSFLCRYELIVDKSRLGSKNPTKEKVEQTQTSEKKFYFGGSPISPQYANFTGCISNAYFTRYAVFHRQMCLMGLDQYRSEMFTLVELIIMNLTVLSS